jgi:hypothetical protein
VNAYELSLTKVMLDRPRRIEIRTAMRAGRVTNPTIGSNVLCASRSGTGIALLLAVSAVQLPLGELVGGDGVGEREIGAGTQLILPDSEMV